MAAADLASLDADERQRDPLSGRGPLGGLVVHLDASHAHLAPARLDDEPVARADAARPEGAGDDGADPAERERAVDREAGRAVGRAAPGRAGHPVEGRAQGVEPKPRPRRHLDDLRVGMRAVVEELGDAEAGELRAVVVDQVALGQRDHAVADAEQLHDRGVLARLRHDAVVRGHDEQEEVDPGRAGDHRPDEALVAGTSTTDSRRPDGSSSGANPSSIEMPRAFSCGSRSVSTPVSAATSAVLPWSM